MALDLARRRRKWLLLLAAGGLSGYGFYKLYHLPSVTRKRQNLLSLLKALASITEAVSSSAEAAALISSDLNHFLRSDSDEIPNSLKQLSKIAQSNHFSASVSRVSEALTVGITKGVSSAQSSSPSFSDKLLDKLFSNEGSGFASIVVGSFARNLVIGFYSTGSDRSDEGLVPWWINLVMNEKVKEVFANWIRLFVSTAVAVYLDKTMEVNTYEEFFAGLTNPKHETKVKEFLVSVCNGAVETLVKTYHQVLTSSPGSSDIIEEKEFRERTIGWVDQVSSTLAIPSNRRLVLDVTGRVTFETVRSFLEFLSRKTREGTRRGVKVVHEEVVERGLEVVRYLTAKSMLVATICIALCMRVLAGMRIMVPV